MNIIVTGASRGIGFETVKLLSQNNVFKIIATARNNAGLEKLKTECKNKNVITVACDLSDEQQLTILIETVKKELGVIDVLINNAGAIVNKPFQEISQEELKTVYQVNVFSVFQLIQQLLPFMNRETKSHIVNISSVGGVQGSVKFSGLSAYSSSKAALVCLTECLAEEFKNENIAFNCLALGATQTQMLEEAFPGYKAPLSASDMAKFITQFALTAHNYLNGKILPVSLSTP